MGLRGSKERPYLRKEGTKPLTLNTDKGMQRTEMAERPKVLRAEVNKILHHSVVDGPGNRAAVFFQGCNFHCAYCHNPETIAMCTSCGHCVEVCPAGALTLQNGKVRWQQELCCECDRCIHECAHLASPRTKDYTAGEIMEEIRKDLPFIRGLTVSGGECSMQRDFVVELFRLAKAEGLSTLMDSNGSYDYSKDEELLAVCDGVMLDIKAFDEEEHKKLTGQSREMVLKNAVYLAGCGKLEEIRTVVVPEFLSGEETVEKVGQMLEPYLKEQKIRYKIIAYRPFGVRVPYKETLRSPSAEELERCKEIAKSYGFSEVVVI